MIITRDMETRSTVDLEEVGVYLYATHPTTEVLTYCYCVDDGPVQVWHPGVEPVPKVFFKATKWVAHFAQFETQIEQHILTPRYGFPEVKMEQQVCTMAQANAVALPGKLEKVAKAINSEHQKDEAGARLMMQMAKPRKPKKGEDPNGIYYVDTPEKRAQLDEYCKMDVAATREIYQSLPDLTEQEQQIWLLSESVNDHGFHLDRNLAKAAAKIAEEMKPRINDELTKITNGIITAFTQVPRITKWVRQHVPEIKSLNKEKLGELLDGDLPDHVRRVLELRLLGAQAAVAKVGALLQRRSPDGRVRGSFVYHAAGTGRWSSRGAQVHNLKRPLTKELQKAIEVIGSGDTDLAQRTYNNPLSVIGDLIRSMVIAAPGHVLIGGDFSGIEARVTAWIAKEESKLEVFRKYDAGLGPDPYIVAASTIFGMPTNQIGEESPQRQVGKGAELAFGFQGGVNAYKRFLPGTSNIKSDTQVQAVWQAEHNTRSGSEAAAVAAAVAANVNINFTDEEIEEIKVKWRAAHPRICSLWHNLKNAIEYAVDRKYTEDDPAVVRDRIRIWFEGGFMWIELPGGRRLAYPHARYGRSMPMGKKSKFVTFGTKWGPEGVVFKDNASGAWNDTRMYGGLATENIVQAIARDLLAEAMLRAKAAGFEIVAHVHDEIVIEVPERQAEFAKARFVKLMSQSPTWADGLPIKVKAWINKRYMK